VHDHAREVRHPPSGTLDGARAALGAALARLRRRSGLTGQQLGRQVGMSQGKISKIENGAVTPSARDVARLAEALGADADEVRNLVERTEGLHDQFTDWRLTVERLTSGQQELAHDEERATRIAVFQMAAVPGLLQTAEYARAVLTEHATVLSGNDPGQDPHTAPAAVSLRIQRQEVLEDARKHFEFIIAEVVLSTPVGSPAQMLAQLERIRSVAGQENVQIRILPWDAGLAFRPVTSFHLFDDRVVVIDLIGTTVISRGQEDARIYRTVFDHFLARSSADIGPILDRYVLRYADQARAAVRHDPADR
jgi:transcriptional regulator with XRE-family HTH domain